MAFVILSAGTLAQSKMHTVSIRSLVAIVAATLIIVLAGGFALGYKVSRSTAESPPVELGGLDEGQGRLVVERFGELSARLLQLEAEAVDLAARIGMIKDFESRISFEGVNQQEPRPARTAPATASGGPLLQPMPADEGAADSGDEAVSGSDERSALEPWSLQMARMEQEIGRVAGDFARLGEVATSYSLAFMSFPVRPPVAGVEIGSSFGNRIDPFRRRLAFHGGIDYAAPKGTPILASAGGKVVFAGYRRAYGKTVEVDHGAGYVTRYAHASRLLVKVGQVVMPGQVIAKVGSTGRSTGPHLHFEILKDGYYIDPAPYVAAL